MSTVEIHPSTLGGIKRLAKTLKREKNLTHTQALDEAAKAAGFHNLRHAQDALPAAIARQVHRSTEHPLYITAYWRTKEGKSGRETLLVHMRQSWCELLKPRELSRTRALRYFRIDAADHLETIEDINGQESARDVVCAAVRTLQFMEVAGLRPATDRAREFLRVTCDLPGHDHESIWADPVTGQFVLSDEPYKDSPEFVAKRISWARNNGLVVTSPDWAGMYVPGASVLSLLSTSEFATQLHTITEQLNRLASPMIAEQWSGESSAYAPVFVSPSRQTSGRIKRARPLPVRPGERRNGAVAYGNVMVGAQWRPAGRMPLSSHEEAGHLLKALLESHQLPARTYHQVNRVRSELDEWVQREYTASELPQKQFSELYYGTAKSTGLGSNATVDRVIEIVRLHYADCAPRRKLLRTLTSIRKTTLSA